MNKILNSYIIYSSYIMNEMKFEPYSNDELEKLKEVSHELDNIMKELEELYEIQNSINNLVVEQHDTLQITETTVENVNTNVNKGTNELVIANSYNNTMSNVKKGLLIMTGVVVMTTVPVGVLLGAKIALIPFAVSVGTGGMFSFVK